MPIVLREIFDVREDVYSDFMHRYHSRIIELLNQFHDGLGVVGPSKLTNDTRWSTIELTNNIGRSIEIVTSLESLWLYGYRRSSNGDQIFPWKLVSGCTSHGDFSSLPGQHESLGFEGNYTTSISTQNVSRPALNNAITVLDNYSHRPANSDKARNSFLVMVLYFAEALRILPIRDLLCNNFAQHESVEVGAFKMNLAQNWHVISSAFLRGSYSRLAVEYQIHNANDLKEKLWLVYNKRTALHDLDGVRDSRPGDPGNGDETGPRESGMGGYSGDGGPKRSGGLGGSKNEGGQPRDGVSSSRSRRPKVGRGRSGNLVPLPLSHDLVVNWFSLSLFFYSTAFGLSRALHRLQQQQSADNTNSSSVREVRVSQLQRQKVCVSRNRILDSAAKVMEMFSSQKAVLEVEYFGEVGTGLAPTLEFYTLLSHDLQKASLCLWRSSSNFEDSSVMETDLGSDGKKPGVDLTGRSNDLVRAPFGLFPCPWSVNADMSEGSQFYKVMEYFRLTGRVMVKALQDGRLLDLPLSTAFYKLVLGQELDLHGILSFDTEFGKILQELQILVHRKKYLESSGDSTQAIDDLRFPGAPIEDLCLDFTLPGYPGYVLKEGEESTSVNIDNLEEYISLVVDATVKMGIARQMEAFRTGYNQVFDVTSLQIFSPNELDYLICGHRELWEAETLVDHIKFDDGYTAKSPVIVNLLEIMAEFSPEQQHAFCQFVTGAPWLPPGGLAALSPKLTIVRKHLSNVTSTPTGTGATEFADEDFPSVMTSANYLEIPPYSTKEVMYKKLLYAINEGQGSFDLS